MATKPYFRSSWASMMYDKMLNDNDLRNLDKSKWYDVDLDQIDPDFRSRFEPSCSDQETEDFLEMAFEKSDWLLTQIYHALVRSVLCWFMSRTSINGFLGRGSMFVFSSSRFESLLMPDIDTHRELWQKEGNLLDLGAGDGKVTDIMARHFRNVYATEVSGVMRKVLADKNYKVLEVESWHQPDQEPVKFDVISCLNLLDRCDEPVSLLGQIRDKLKPETGLFVLAVVLPFSQYVESGPKHHKPKEEIGLRGTTFEEQVSSLGRDLFRPQGFEVVRWTRLPYLSEGDMEQAFYWLNDAVFVLRLADPC